MLYVSIEINARTHKYSNKTVPRFIAEYSSQIRVNSKHINGSPKCLPFAFISLV